MSQTTERIHELVDKLNQHRDEYYKYRQHCLYLGQRRI